MFFCSNPIATLKSCHWYLFQVTAVAHLLLCLHPLLLFPAIFHTLASVILLTQVWLGSYFAQLSPVWSLLNTSVASHCSSHRTFAQCSYLCWNALLHLQAPYRGQLVKHRKIKCFGVEGNTGKTSVLQDTPQGAILLYCRHLVSHTLDVLFLICFQLLAEGRGSKRRKIWPK